MQTSKQVYDRIRWDPGLDPARCRIGIDVHAEHLQEVAFAAFEPGGDIPWHRIVYFAYDGEAVWDRRTRLDRLAQPPPTRLQADGRTTVQHAVEGAITRDGVTDGPDERTPSRDWRAALVEDPRRTARARELVERLRALVPDAEVLLLGSRRLGCAVATSDLDLAILDRGTPVLRDAAARVRAAVPDLVELRLVTGTVPGLRFLHDPEGVDLPVDITWLGTGELAPSDALLDARGLSAGACAVLAAARDADAIRAAVDTRHDAFRSLARAVKTWAHARGLDAPWAGGMPGLAWAMLAARAVVDATPAELDGSLDARLRRFFARWAEWDWARPVTWSRPPPDDGSPIRIATPTEPVHSQTKTVGTSMAELLRGELAEAARPDAGPSEWLSAPPLTDRHQAFALLRVEAPDGESRDISLGWVRERALGLLLALEGAGAAGAHFWPRPLRRDGCSVEFAIGLGPDAPSEYAVNRATMPFRTAHGAWAGRPWGASLEVRVVARDALPALR